MQAFISIFILSVFVTSAYSDSCEKPEVLASAYVTEDATVLSQVAFTTQFTLKCSNGMKGMLLYADVEGKSLPAVRLSADNRYQVSLEIRIFLFADATAMLNLVFIMFVGLLDR